ncbi:hypothetical protein ACFS3C_04325 [Azotobacter vinelandii]|uniref:AMP-binding enzyme n=1 Tax=Azotobacter TaxID=352 RepID=UPI0000527286|nr:hypothetical protein [Azotobacter vinelandii]GLK62003.1 hypothetical protein GCM10017624_41670 [Azotobacter vinelandii]SFY19207.1 AMP-binding enzyme C-terminal domain-containing protein [Azotobacter vinelandii]
MDIREKTPNWPESFNRLYIEKNYWAEETFVSLLDTDARRIAYSPANVGGECTITYRQLRTLKYSVFKRARGRALELDDLFKDQINKGAEKVSPEKAEDVIIKTGLVSDAVVVAQVDEYVGDRIVGIVIANSSTNLTDLKRHLHGIMANYKLPDVFIEVEHFPTTGVGKLSRRALRQQVQLQLLKAKKC